MFLSFKSACRSENMWVSHRVDVKSALKTGDNKLHISFASPFIKVRGIGLQRSICKR